MRSAEASKAWRRVIRRNRAFRLNKIRLSGKPPFADFTEDLHNGLTVICGLNGVGKTTLLRLVEAALGSADQVGQRCRQDLLESGDFAVGLERNGVTAEVGFADSPQASRPLVLDAFRLCSRILSVGAQPNFEDLLEGVEPHEYSEDERETARYVVGRVYDSISVYEVEATGDADDLLIPVFEVRVGDRRYDFRTMGLGELAALTMLWLLARTDAGTVLLIEEPETFLSSQSTVAFLDVVAAIVDRKQLYAILTTHSIEIVSRAPLECVRLLVERPDGVILYNPDSRAELEQLLNTYVGLYRLAIVEDRAAKLVTLEFLSRFGDFWAQAVDVAPTTGVDSVLDLCARVPRTKGLRLVGIVDGDQSIENSAEWPVLVLPGGGPPDQFLQAAAINAPPKFAAALRRPTDSVYTVIQSKQGLDYHDWFRAVGMSLGLDEDAVLRAAIDCWLDVDCHVDQAKEFVVALVEQLAS